MAYTRQDMKIILHQYAGFGSLIYQMYQCKKVALDEIRSIFFKLDPEQSSFYLNRIVKRASEEDLDKALKEASCRHSQERCFQECFGLSQCKIWLRNDFYETILNYYDVLQILSDLIDQDPNGTKLYRSYQNVLYELLEETKKTVLSKQPRLESVK